MLDNGFNENFFPAPVLKESDTMKAQFPKLLKQSIASLGKPLKYGSGYQRKDYRGKFCFSIDNPGARALDDILSIEKVGPEVWKLGIHISDVNEFVRSGSSLDKEASLRVES